MEYAGIFVIFGSSKKSLMPQTLGKYIIFIGIILVIAGHYHTDHRQRVAVCHRQSYKKIVVNKQPGLYP
jgi:hypothetical protein